MKLLSGVNKRPNRPTYHESMIFLIQAFINLLRNSEVRRRDYIIV